MGSFCGMTRERRSLSMTGMGVRPVSVSPPGAGRVPLSPEMRVPRENTREPSDDVTRKASRPPAASSLRSARRRSRGSAGLTNFTASAPVTLTACPGKAPAASARAHTKRSSAAPGSTGMPAKCPRNQTRSGERVNSALNERPPCLTSNRGQPGSLSSMDAQARRRAILPLKQPQGRTLSSSDSEALLMHSAKCSGMANSSSPVFRLTAHCTVLPRQQSVSMK